MKSTIEQDEKKKYLAPNLEILLLEWGKDILCTSPDAGDQDFGADSLGGGFLD